MPTQSVPRDPGVPMRHDVHRLFFALWPDQALREQLDAVTIGLMAEHATRGRRTASDRYHLTLQFLGDFAEQAPSVTAAAKEAADSVRGRAFELVIDHAGSFGRTRVGWLGPTSMPAGLRHLWDGLGLALAERGITPKSVTAFTPHVTVLRNMRQPLPALPIPPLAWPVSCFVLVDSQPGQGIYKELQRWPLQR